MRLIATLCWLVAIPVGSLSFATSPAEAATAENIAGAWRAVGPSGTHYRLVLDAHSRGQLGMAVGGSERVYEIESVKYDGNSVRMRLADMARELAGEAYPGQFLKLSGGQVWGDLDHRPWYGRMTQKEGAGAR